MRPLGTRRSAHFGWIGARMRTLSLTDSTSARRAPDRGSNNEKHRPGIHPMGRKAGAPRREASYYRTETGLVMATQTRIHRHAAHRCLPPASILPSEAFRYNQPDVASHHWPLDQVREPTVRTCGSSRTSQDYYRNNNSSLVVSRVKLTCLTTV